MADDNFGEINSLISSLDTLGQRVDTTDRRIAQIDQTVDRSMGMQQLVAERVMTHDTILDDLKDADKTITQAVRDVQTRCEMSTAELYGRVGELRGTVDSLERGDMYADSDLVLGRPVGNRIQFGIDQTRQGLGYLYYSSGSKHYCRVYAGALRVPGVGNYAVSQTDVEMTATSGDFWIYLTCTWSSPSATAVGSITEPTSTAAILNFPLYKFTKNTDGTYYLARILHWGDAIAQKSIVPDSLDTSNPDVYCFSTGFSTAGYLEIYGASAVDTSANNCHVPVLQRTAALDPVGRRVIKWLGSDYDATPNNASIDIDGVFSILNWATAATELTLAAADLLMYKSTATGQPDFMSYTNLLSQLQDDLTFTTSYLDLTDTYDITYSGKAGWIPTVYESPGFVYDLRLVDPAATAIHPHSKHTAEGLAAAFSSDDHNVASTMPLLRLNSGGDSTRNACHASMRIGAADNSASIGPSTRKAYQGDGTTAILDWNATTAGIYLNATAWFKNNSGTPLFQIDANNTWAAAALAVKVAGAITLDASTGGALTLKANLASTWEFASDLHVDPKVDGAGGVSIGQRGTSWDTVDIHGDSSVLLGGAGTGILYLGSALTTFADINYNGFPGVDITDWTTKGGLTGTGVGKYRVRVVNADTGADLDIEVLGRAI